MERGALVDKMFYSIQLAFRKVPASLAVATLIVCTFWGIASGLVGAVVVLMGVIAFNPMLQGGIRRETRLRRHHGRRHARHSDPAVGHDHRLRGGRRSVDRSKLYAAAMFPGFFLSFLYLVYIIGWAMINPKIAPRLPEEQTKVPVPAWLPKFEDTYRSQSILISLVKGAALAVEGKADRRGAVTASATGCWSQIFVTPWCRLCWSPARFVRSGGTSSFISRRLSRPP